ncbi:restriction endonuclease subunit S [Cognataquiflexum aquatile]|uniref:restriction endonuclease subunit S n=1 Tax=Cognataquiflexum aquatile TaxID=2249427 RepID=UPI000DEA8360|nr:restriction endonuclease subunit S [Cognataquiflexum aquatile]
MMQLLEHFKELTLHPKNAQELKGLILQLAVQGKLTKKWREENPGVEPASVLLERINDEKEILIKEKKIKKEKLFPEISEEDIPYKLPEGWIWSRLEEIVTLKSGTSFNSTLELTNGDFMYVKVGAMNLPGNEIEITTSNLYINSDPKLNKALIPTRSIIFPKRGGAIATNKKRLVFQPIHVDLNTMAITCLENFNFMYLKHWFNSIDLWTLNNGTSVPQINNKDIAPLLVSIPPLEEQKAIVEVVNQLFAEVEQLEALTQERIQLKSDFVTSALNQLTQAAEQDTASQWAFLQEYFGTFFNEKENIKKLREGILQLAVQGKLTRDWRVIRQALGTPTEPVSTLLENIKKEKSITEISIDKIPYQLPKSWEWSRFYVVAALKHGHQFRQFDFVEKGIPVVKIGQCKPDGTLDLSKADYIDISRKSEFKDVLIEKGDLLMALTGGTLGKVTRVDKDYGVIVQNYRVGNFYADSRILSLDFLNVILESELFQGLVRDRINQNAQPNIGKDNIEKILLPIPPKEEQKAIVEKVNSLMALCDNLEQEIETHQTTLEQWMQSCLREVVGFFPSEDKSIEKEVFNA